MSTKYTNAVSHFDRIAASETEDWGDLQWHGQISNCDICSRPMEGEKYMIDGPAASGPFPPWGNLCVVCAHKYAPNIGWGKGQLYQKFPKGRWKLISGGPPKETEDEYL